MQGVYLIHFDEPLAHAQHYIGYAEDINERLNAHRVGRGARLLAACNAVGISYRIVRIWNGPGADRNFERRLKRRKNARRLCPTCRKETTA